MSQLSQRAEARIADAPKSYRKMYRKALEGDVSPRIAIKVMCLACMGWDRGEVRRCTSAACPLNPYRPFQGGVDDDPEVTESSGRGLCAP